MSLVRFPLAGTGGDDAYINPSLVICLMKAGQKRTQVVTTGLTGEASISLIVAMDLDETAAQLSAASFAAA
jgi:hypothetical protein